MEQRKYPSTILPTGILGSDAAVRQSSHRNTTPSLLLNAVPKSASTYLSEVLEQGLSAKRIRLTVGIFPEDLILFSQIQTFAEGGQIARQHFSPTDTNLAYLRHFNVRPIIHVRDPRAVLVSWTHQLANVSGGWKELFWYYPAICPPPTFLERNFAWQLDWCLEHHFSVFLDWICDWCAAADRWAVEVLFTSFEDFVVDEDRTLIRILEFSGLIEKFKRPQVAPAAGLLFREGKIDGWRAVASRIAAAATRAVPEHLWTRFAWKP
jgi:Sulfotransferase domain